MYTARPVTGIVEGYEVFEPSEESSRRMNEIIQNYEQRLLERTDNHLGYPYNLNFEVDALQKLQKYSINNLGDPWVESNYGVHSREFEIGVLNWFAKFWKINQEDMWGYITNCGTEGNLHGILLGRENYPDGILYASRESHYSVKKAARMYRMEIVLINTLSTGEIDLSHLKECLTQGKLQNKPAILNINCGTTVRGAVDDLDGVIATLQDTGYNQDEYYIHVDGALFGMMLPFIQDSPIISFEKPIGSISVSGHKFLGSPVPCGVIITRKHYLLKLSSSIEYLNSIDSTIMGSRNGHASLYIWYTLSRKGIAGLQQDVIQCMNNSIYLRDLLYSHGISCSLNKLSSTVVFEKPKKYEFIKKWQLACEGNIAHVIVMPNITREKLDQFVKELIEDRDESTVITKEASSSTVNETVTQETIKQE